MILKIMSSKVIGWKGSRPIANAPNMGGSKTIRVIVELWIVELWIVELWIGFIEANFSRKKISNF